MASVTLTSSLLSPSVVSVRCSGVNIGLKRDVKAEPNSNPTNLAYAHTQGVENPTYVLQGVHITGESGTLTYAQLLTLLKINYDNSNAPRLAVTYGTSTQLVAFNGTSTSIPVVMTGFNINLSTQDSRSAYLPTGTISFIETR